MTGRSCLSARCLLVRALAGIAFSATARRVLSVRASRGSSFSLADVEDAFVAGRQRENAARKLPAVLVGGEGDMSITLSARRRLRRETRLHREEN